MCDLAAEKELEGAVKFHWLETWSKSPHVNYLPSSFISLIVLDELPAGRRVSVLYGEWHLWMIFSSAILAVTFFLIFFP